MAEENSVKPRLGRIGNRGVGGGKKLSAQIQKISATLAKPKGRKGFSGKINGRGSTAFASHVCRRHAFAKFRARRVVVKTHIARVNKGVGNAAFKAHLKYIQRDGVERDGSGGELYNERSNKISDRDFLERSENDRHQFRIIVSPEDADKLPDLKENTRLFMKQMERDLGTKLDWVAVDHHNTGYPHTHIVIRGKDENSKDLVIARDYITQGMRRLASDLVTQQIGPRQDLEIARSQEAEVTKERFTDIDRRLSNAVSQNRIVIAKAEGVYERFERTLRIRRLHELEKLQLAKRDGIMNWRLSEGWEDSLKAMGKRHDIIRSISHAMGSENEAVNAKVFDSSDRQQRPVLGRIKAIGPEDELRDTRFIVVEGMDGHLWHVSLGSYEPGSFPGNGAIVEVTPNEAKARRSDKIITTVAFENNGIYSDVLHEAHDPSSSAAYRETHKRRLEAMRRAGFATRNSDGTWQIGSDHLEQAARYEMNKTGNAQLDVKSWLPLEKLVNHDGLTWLDQLDSRNNGVGAFANEMAQALEDRRRHLTQNGDLKPEEKSLPIGKQHLLQARERSNAARSEATGSKRAYVFVEQGEAFRGVYEKPVDLAQGRFAVIGNSKEFTLVPWRPDIERHRGNPLVARGTASGIGWNPDKKRGIGR